MKRLISIFVMVTMLTLPTLSSYAAASFHDYIPEIPNFFTVSFGKITFNVPIGNAPDAKKFYDSFYSDGKPYFILLEQRSYWPAKEDSKEPYYKNFVVTFVKPKIQNLQSSLGTFLYEGATNGDNGSDGNKAPYYIAPMNYLPTSAGYECMSFIYDSDDNVCYQTGSGSSTYPIRFTYVLASSSTFKNGTPKEYPYFNALSNKEHTFVSEVVSPWKDRHYNWWLGVNGSINNPDNGQDTDGDGKPDLDVDTDGDGKPDLNVDADKDGKPDLNVDTDKDGKPDLNVDTDKDAKPDLNVDTDKDGKPDLNVNTDKDSKPDLNVDTDKDGKPDLNVDTDKDDKPDLNVDTDKDSKADLNVDTDKDGKPDLNVDTDKDGKPDLNVDTNGDGNPDINIDTDKDGKPDLNIDTDKDNKPDINVDTNGDKFPDINIDTDGDLKPDLNVDTNGDGKPDSNLKPDAGSGGGSGGTGGGSGSGGGGTDSGSGGQGFNWDDWFPNTSDPPPYDLFPVFDPFDPQYNSPPKYNNPYTDYDPMEGQEGGGNYPVFPGIPGLEDYQFYDPFKKPS